MVAQALKPPGLPPYGARELRDVARSYMVRAVMAGSSFWFAVYFVALGASVLFLRPSTEIVIPPAVHNPIPPPNYVEKPKTRQRSVTPPVAQKKGDIAPVAEEKEVPVESRTDAPPPNDGSLTRSGVDDGKTNTLTGTDEDVPPPPDKWFNVDELPEAITKVEPIYPEIAREAGVSGTVYVRVLVGKNGHVRDAFVEPKHSILLLNEAALEAARRWVFKPAFTNNHPVSVWVVIPMRFSLN